MANGESYENESKGGWDIAGDASERARRIRAQAELAWARVQRVARRGAYPALSAENILQSAETIPTAAYLGGIFGSLMASTWLYASGRRTAGLVLGVLSSLLLVGGLYAKSVRQSPR